jgi:Guanylate kinase
MFRDFKNCEIGILNLDQCLSYLSSIVEVRKRIQKRGLDSEDVIEKRMKNALKELGEAEEYDYFVINDVFEHAIEELHKMVINKDFKDHKYDKKLKILQDLLF